MAEELGAEMEELPKDTEVKLYEDICDLCQSREDTTVLPCRHRFCHSCLEQLQATELEGELTCVVCSSHAPLPQNGDRGQDEKGHPKSKLLELNTLDVTTGNQPSKHLENSNHAQEGTATFNSVQEELPSESEAPNVDHRKVVTAGKPIEGQIEDAEYFLCLNNSDTKYSPGGTVEKELLPEPKETDTTEYEHTGEAGDINHFQDSNSSDLMSKCEKGWKKSTTTAATTTAASKTAETVVATTTAAKPTTTTTPAVATTTTAAKTTTTTTAAKTTTTAAKTTTTTTTAAAKTTTTAAKTTTTAAKTTTVAKTTTAEATATAEANSTVVTTTTAAKTTKAEATTTTAMKTTTSKITTAEATTKAEAKSTVVTSTKAAKTTKAGATTPLTTKTTTAAAKTTAAPTVATTTTHDVPARQQETPKRSHSLNSDDRKYILVSKKGRKSHGELGDSKLHVRFDIPAAKATIGPIGPAETTESLQNGDIDKTGVNVTSPDRDLDKQLKESSPLNKKGVCKCPRGEVKAVHCSVCQKYVCLHCATHEHKDHSEEEIQEALDKEREKIKHGLDIASTCAEAHQKRVEELAAAEQNLLKQFEDMSIRIADHSEIALSLINERVESIVQAVQEEAEKARESVREFKAESLEDLIVAFEERRGNIAEERDAAQVAFAASSSYSNISRKILEDGSSAVVLTSSNSLSEVFKTLKYPYEKTSAPSVIPADYDRRLWFVAPEVNLNGEIQKWFGKVINSSCKEVVAEGTKRETKSPPTQHVPTLIATLQSATTKLHRTFSVATDEENDIIVAGQNIVRIFSSDTMRLKSAVALAFNPEGLAAYGDEIFVTGNGHNIHVLKKSGDSRRVLHVEGVLSRLQGLAVDSTGRIIATEGRQVFVLLSDGTDVCTFDVASEGGPVRLYPATNSSDRIIISDQSGHTIKLYDASGNLIRQFGGKGKDDGQLLSPADVCADAEDNFIVADTKNNRVSQFNPDGTFEKHLVVEENYVRFPWGVAMTRDGRLVVSSLAVGQAVKIFDLHKNSS